MRLQPTRRADSLATTDISVAYVTPKSIISVYIQPRLVSQ